jgi:hypothetical protein
MLPQLLAVIVRHRYSVLLLRRREVKQHCLFCFMQHATTCSGYQDIPMGTAFGLSDAVFFSSV